MGRYVRGGMNYGDGGTGGAGFCVPLRHYRRTPDHPPYSEMVNVALRALADENGSMESSISAYIQSHFHGLPWGHDRLLPYYLSKLVVAGELTCPSPDRYKLDLQSPYKSFTSAPIRRRGRPRIQTSNHFPSFNPIFSFPSRSRQSRSRPYRSRGRPRKILLEDAPAFDPGQGALVLQGPGSPSNDLGQTIRLLRRGRGRPRLPRDNTSGRGKSRKKLTEDIAAPDVGQGALPLDQEQPVFDLDLGAPLLDLGQSAAMLLAPGQSTPEFNLGHALPLLQNDCMMSHISQEDDIGRIAIENLDFTDRRSMGSKKNDDSILIINISTSSFFEGSDHTELNQEPPKDRQPFMAREHCNEQDLQEPALLIPEQNHFVVHEHYKSYESFLQGEEQTSVTLEQIELSQNHLSPEGLLPLSTHDPIIAPLFSSTELCEQDHGYSNQGEAPSFMSLEKRELVQDQNLSLSEWQPVVTSGQEKLSLVLVPEHQRLLLAAQTEALHQSQGEAPTFMPSELAELNIKQLSIESPLLSPEQLAHNNSPPLELPDQHEDRLLGVEMVDSKEGSVEPAQRSDKEEAKNVVLSSKKRKSREKTNRHRLWFEA